MSGCIRSCQSKCYSIIEMPSRSAVVIKSRNILQDIITVVCLGLIFIGGFLFVIAKANANKNILAAEGLIAAGVSGLIFNAIVVAYRCAVNDCTPKELKTETPNQEIVVYMTPESTNGK